MPDCVFLFFWHGFYGPFKNISLISSRSFIKGGRKPENPGKNHLTICKQNLAFPHVTQTRLEPQRWETWWIKSQFSYLLGYGGPRISVYNAYSVDPDQAPRSAASDLGLHCLPMFLSLDTRHNWVRKKQLFITLWQMPYVAYGNSKFINALQCKNKSSFEFLAGTWVHIICMRSMFTLVVRRGWR